MKRAAAMMMTAALAMLLGLAGCPAAHQDYPTTNCKRSIDCYAGESCIDSFCVKTPPDMSAITPPDVGTPTDLQEISDGGADI
jgi:hypothetical protein